MSIIFSQILNTKKSELINMMIDKIKFFVVKFFCGLVLSDSFLLKMYLGDFFRD